MPSPYCAPVRPCPVRTNTPQWRREAKPLSAVLRPRRHRNLCAACALRPMCGSCAPPALRSSRDARSLQREARSRGAAASLPRGRLSRSCVAALLRLQYNAQPPVCGVRPEVWCGAVAWAFAPEPQTRNPNP